MRYNLRMSFICCIFDLNKTTMKVLTIKEMRAALVGKMKHTAHLKATDVRFHYQRLFKY